MTGAAIMLAFFLWREINDNHKDFGWLASSLCVAAVTLMGFGVQYVSGWLVSWL